MYGVEAQINIHHLTKEQFILQLEQCADSAYHDLGVEVSESTYDGEMYDWTIETINTIIDKNFSKTISQDQTGAHDVTYHVGWYREKKNLYFRLIFRTKRKSIGETYFLFGLMRDDGVKGIIKLQDCKKEINKYLQA